MELYATVRIRNILRAIGILEDYWKMEEDEVAIYCAAGYGHDEISAEKLEVLDFIPY